MKCFECFVSVCYCLNNDFWIHIAFSLLECPWGMYGMNCEQECTCENGAECDRMSGCCSCTAGYYGQNCQFSKEHLFFLIPTLLLNICHFPLCFHITLFLSFYLLPVSLNKAKPNIFLLNLINKRS